mgnify:CR=1 FL=1
MFQNAVTQEHSMTVKVIVTDMDGTFLDDAKQYDRDRFQAQFEQLNARGI